jgi:hypothetical protein
MRTYGAQQASFRMSLQIQSSIGHRKKANKEEFIFRDGIKKSRSISGLGLLFVFNQ